MILFYEILGAVMHDILLIVTSTALTLAIILRSKV